LAFFSNFVGRFWPFFTEGLAFFEKRNPATLVRRCLVTACSSLRCFVVLRQQFYSSFYSIG